MIEPEKKDEAEASVLIPVEPPSKSDAIASYCIKTAQETSGSLWRMVSNPENSDETLHQV